MDTTDTIGIVVTTWNGLEGTRATIESIRATRSHQIIVSDNASTDGTQQWAEEQGYPLVESGTNLGCGHARNAGMGYAFAYGCDPVIVCQNDVLLHRDCIDNLVEFQKRDGCAMACSARVTDLDLDDPSTAWFNSQRIEQYDRLINQSGPPARIDTAAMLGRLDGVAPRDVTGGVSALVVALMPRRTIQRVGWFDEGFTIADWETRDYVRRIEWGSGRAASTQLALHHHTGANSWLYNKVDRDRTKDIEMKRCEDRYIAKWGGTFLSETHAPMEQASLWPGMTMVKWRKKRKRRGIRQ